MAESTGRRSASTTVAPVVTMDPTPGGVTPTPFVKRGTVRPPFSVVELRNGVTGNLLGVTTSDAQGRWEITVTGASGVAPAIRSASVQPQAASAGRLSKTAQPQKAVAARRSAKAQAQAIGTRRRSGKAPANATEKALRSATAQPVSGATARRSETVQGQKTAAGLRSARAAPQSVGTDTALRSGIALGQQTATGRRSGKAQANAAASARRAETATAAADTTAPSVSAFSVTPPGSGTNCTFDATITDAVGVTKWLLVEGASDPGAADPGQTGATTVASTTSLSLTSQTFTSSASATGTRYWRLHAWDAAGNHGVSSVVSGTVTVGGGADISYVGAGQTTSATGGGGLTGVAHPSSLQSGDLLLLFSRTGIATPSGWTLLVQDAPGVTQLFGKMATGSESHTLVTTPTDFDDGEGGTYRIDGSARMYAFRGASLTLDKADAAPGSFTGSTVTGSALTGLAAGDALLFFAYSYSGNSYSGTYYFSACGGGADILVATDLSGSNLTSAGSSIAMAYKLAAASSPGAPTMTTNSGASVTGNMLTVALKKA